MCVDIRYACANPGTICASVIILGSHGISILYVCVHFIVLPFGREILIGNLDGCLLTTGATSIRKCPVPPESEKSHSTYRFIFGILILVVEIGISCVLFACTIALPAVCIVGMGSGSGLSNYATFVIIGAHSPAYVASSSFVVIVP